MTHKAPDQTTTRTIVWAVVVLFIGSLGAVIALVTFVDDSSLATTLVAAVFTNLAAMAAVLVKLLSAQAAVADAVGKVEQHTSALTNGLLDAKVRTAVAEVLRPELVDPNAHQQLRADTKRRDAYDAAAKLLQERQDGDA